MPKAELLVAVLGKSGPQKPIRASPKHSSRPACDAQGELARNFPLPAALPEASQGLRTEVACPSPSLRKESGFSSNWSREVQSRTARSPCASAGTSARAPCAKPCKASSTATRSCARATPPATVSPAKSSVPASLRYPANRKGAKLSLGPAQCPSRSSPRKSGGLRPGLAPRPKAGRD